MALLMSDVSFVRELIGLHTSYASLGVTGLSFQSASNTIAISVTSGPTVVTIPKSRVMPKYSLVRLNDMMMPVVPSMTKAFSVGHLEGARRLLALDADLRELLNRGSNLPLLHISGE